MKKLLGNLLFTITAIVTCISLYSCGDGDDPFTPPIVTPGGDDIVEPPVTTGNYMYLSISADKRSSDGMTTHSEVLSNPSYEIASWLGRPVLKSCKGILGNYTYTYSLPNKLVCNGPLHEITFTFENNKISKKTISGSIEDAKYEYDSKNRLVKTIMSYGSSTMEDIYTYDGTYNITRYQRKVDNVVARDMTIEYTTIPAKSIPLQCVVTSFLGDAFKSDFWPAMEMGAFGNSVPLYLIKRIVGGNLEREYTYTLNSAGYVSQMIDTIYDADGTTYSTYNIYRDVASVLF